MGMEQLARTLQQILQKPVVNKTGIDGKFDLSLQYENGHPESLLEILENIGFDFEEVMLPAEFLIIDNK